MALFQTANLRPIPILTYHQIEDAPPKGAAFRSLYVSPQAFARQMAFLSFFGYRGLSMSALMPYLTGEQVGRVVGITFDDGYLNNLTNALPILNRHGFSSTCYAVSQQLGKTNAWDEDVGILQTSLMDSTQLRQWLKEGQEVGAHTRHHVHLTKTDHQRCIEEISLCKAELEDLTDTKVDHFCYPYGDFTVDHVDMVKSAGFSSATTTVRNRCRVGDDLFQLSRVPVVRSTTLLQFWMKVGTRYEDRRIVNG